MSEKKAGFMEKLIDIISEKIAPKLMVIFNRPTLNIIKNSMSNVMPFILFGSIMLLVSLLGTTSMGTEKPILPFLAPYSQQIGLINSFTMGFMTIYFAASIGINYADEYHLDRPSCTLLSLMSFFIINYNGMTEGMLPTGAFGAQGLFPTMITSVAALKVYKTCIEKKFVIRMPDGVPPAVGAAFSSLIPYGIVGIVYWFIRTIMGINFLDIITGILKPVFEGADNIFAFTAYATINKILWGLGIHADSLFQGILDPLKMTWIAVNGEAVQAGTAIPYIWTTALERTCLWTGPVFSLLLLLAISKVKHLKTFAFASLPAAAFSIVEPVIFGLPLAMNPLLMIPFILSGFVCGVVTYGACAIGLVSKAFLQLPWATPWVIIGYASSGDWKYIPLTLINVAIGIVIYYPFVKVFERQETLKMENEPRGDMDE